METTPHIHPHHDHEHHDHSHHHSKNLNSNWSIPIAIVLAGALIGLAIYFSGSKKPSQINNNDTEVTAKVKPISADDHIIGNPNAPITIIEYSDLQCPYCAEFDKTMRQVMDTYGKDGKVAWVYRHYWAVRKMSNGAVFHPLGGKAAEASECVAELGGNEKFWSYTKAIFDGQQQGSLSKLSEFAVAEGIDKSKFDSCLSSGKYTKKIQAQYDEGMSAGVRGTPNTFIITKEGTVKVPGAYPFADPDPTQPSMKKIMDEIIDSL